jgi:hypothetical protein
MKMKEKIMLLIKQIWTIVTYRPIAKDLAIKELENAKRSYLENKTHAEYYTTLCSFETQRIKRLEQYLEEPNE